MKNIHKINENIYITSNEEIKEGDWVITYNGLLAKVITEFEWHFKNSKKIILTTDQDLIKDGVQAIDDEFLEWFVKNPSCEEVEVTTEYKDGYGNWFIYDKEFWDKINNEYKPKFGLRYKIIIPKEEPKQEWSPTQGEEVWIKVFSNWSKGTYVGYDVTKETHIVREDEEGGGHLMSSSQVLPYYEMPNKPKRETLEEVKDINYWKNNCEENYITTPISVLRYVTELEKEQERMYSEEDMREVILTSFLLGVDRGSYSKELEDKLIEQFKTK